MDNTTLYANKEELSSDTFETEVNDILEALNNWFELNKLPLNIKKLRKTYDDIMLIKVRLNN